MMMVGNKNMRTFFIYKDLSQTCVCLISYLNVRKNEKLLVQPVELDYHQYFKVVLFFTSKATSKVQGSGGKMVCGFE